MNFAYVALSLVRFIAAFAFATFGASLSHCPQAGKLTVDMALSNLFLCFEMPLIISPVTGVLVIGILFCMLCYSFSHRYAAALGVLFVPTFVLLRYIVDRAFASF